MTAVLDLPAPPRRALRLPVRELVRLLTIFGEPLWALARLVLLPVGWQVSSFLVVIGVALLPAVWLMPLPSHPDQDMTHFRLWIDWIAASGIEQSYSGIFPAQYVIYPPLSLYFFDFVGQVMALWPVPPDTLSQFWPESGHWPEALVRLPVVAFHGLIAATVYWSTLRWKGQRWAVPATLAYAVNPAVLFDLVYWAQPDSYHSFFALIALLALLGRWPELGWAALALAALAKPQAWIFAPIVFLYTWRTHGPGKVAAGMVFFVSAALPVAWPFVVHDRMWELASVFVNFSRVMPVVSANAHNIWWWIVGSDALIKADSALFVGPLTYQTVGLALLVGGYFIGILKLVGDRDRRTLFSVAGYSSLVFFLFATQIHENHAFLVFPMLAMCWVVDWRLAIALLLLTISMFGNVALHDPILEPLAGPWLTSIVPAWIPDQIRPWLTPESLQRLSVAVNLMAFAFWLASFFWAGAGTVSASERRRRAGWAGALGGTTTLAGVALAMYFLMAPVGGIDEGPLAGKISLRPVEEPHERILALGGGTDDPAARRIQTAYLAAAAAAATGLVTIAYVGHQGLALRGS